MKPRLKRVIPCVQSLQKLLNVVNNIHNKTYMVGDGKWIIN